MESKEQTNTKPITVNPKFANQVKVKPTIVEQLSAKPVTKNEIVDAVPRPSIPNQNAVTAAAVAAGAVQPMPGLNARKISGLTGTAVRPVATPEQIAASRKASQQVAQKQVGVTPSEKREPAPILPEELVPPQPAIALAPTGRSRPTPDVVANWVASVKGRLAKVKLTRDVMQAWNATQPIAASKLPPEFLQTITQVTGSLLVNDEYLGHWVYWLLTCKHSWGVTTLAQTIFRRTMEHAAFLCIYNASIGSTDADVNVDNDDQPLFGGDDAETLEG